MLGACESKVEHARPQSYTFREGVMPDTLLACDDDGSFNTGCKFRAAAQPSPSPSVLPEVNCGSRVSTRAGQAAPARGRRARCEARYETRYEAPYEACDAAVQMSDAEPHAEGLLPRPQQLDNVFQGLSNNTLSGL